MEHGGEGGGEEVSKLVNPMISCCSCPSLHQVLLHIRGMDRTSAGATKRTIAGVKKGEGRRYIGRVQALHRTSAGAPF
jgi:hypothetical protein